MAKSSVNTEIKLPACNLYLKGTGTDVNGNRIVKVRIAGQTRAFSIQSNGNLPKTHSILKGLTKKEMKELPKTDLEKISKEVSSYIKSYGSDTQKKALKIS